MIKKIKLIIKKPKNKPTKKRGTVIYSSPNTNCGFCIKYKHNSEFRECINPNINKKSLKNAWILSCKNCDEVIKRKRKEVV